MTYWKTEHFKALQKSWYRRLEEVGFKDAEKLVEGDMVLKQAAEHVFCRADALERETKAAYYRALASRVESETFKTEIDKMILVMRSEGMKITRISAALSAMGVGRHRHWVRTTIRRYETAWGIKTYTAKQLRRAG